MVLWVGLVCSVDVKQCGLEDSPLRNASFKLALYGCVVFV